MTKVLLIDDAPACQAIVRMMLERYGHRVLTAGGAQEAAAIAARETSIGVVVCDLTLGKDVDGLELVGRLRRTLAGVGVVMISGYSAWEGAELFLAKPFSPEELQAMVTQAAPKPATAPCMRRLQFEALAAPAPG